MIAEFYDETSPCATKPERLHAVRAQSILPTRGVPDAYGIEHAAGMMSVMFDDSFFDMRNPPTRVERRLKIDVKLFENQKKEKSDR